ncbi:NAD(P)/FAD-dependent oxidoreductase [Lutibaculum baratangense]|uniref:Opine oxidase subunit B n=1 Tax=Lutibaculum baratangense AMV1 TaxID=631454 RepID=V4TNY7_9HYPH|nr:FAD-dependent oxidoreductase [Lutibaculum baratangense]ESR27388.1 Opine oxidase subunit B [Lutibaculum baratangense AMV1]
MRRYDTIVVGGGLVGAAVAYGLAREGESVAVLDEGDVAFRASRGNFGLVWVQSKGDGRPEYARWTRRSSDLWPGFAELLAEDTGIAPDYHKPGGLHFCFSEAEIEARRAMIHRMHNVHGPGGDGTRILDRKEVQDLVPSIGPDVLGASYSPHDGHASPLRLLRGLHAGLAKRTGAYFADHRVQRIEKDGGGFRVEAGGETFSGGKVVLAAGLGNRELGAQVGLDVPVRPLKGQILVTERTKPVLTMPTHVIRQTEEGTIMMGDSQEDAGFDTRSGTGVISAIAAHAVRTLPWLATVRVVRSWAALRVMTPDGYPLYEQSESHPGAFTVNCHSGVTLAGAHAQALAPMIALGALGEELSAFTSGRFDVRAN